MQPHDTTSQDVPLKRCSKCKEEKPLWEFNRKKSSKDGHNAMCRKCVAARAGYKYHPGIRPGYRRCSACQNEYPATKEFFHADNRLSHGLGSTCRTCSSQRAREWAARNPALVLARSKQWIKENPQRFSRNQRKYRQVHREQRRAIDLRRRARVASAEGTHTTSDIEQQYEAQKGKCYYCSKKVGNDYHVDHVIPLSRGGSNGPENIVIACPNCNWSKNDKLPHEWPDGGRLL